MEATSTEVYSSYKALERTARRAGMVQNDLRAPWNASERYVSGDPQAFTELLQWSLTESGPKIAKLVWQHGYLLHRARYSQNLVIDLFKAVQEIFNLNNNLSVGQFCSSGYTEAKLSYVRKVMDCCARMNKTSVKAHPKRHHLPKAKEADKEENSKAKEAGKEEKPSSARAAAKSTRGGARGGSRQRTRTHLPQRKATEYPEVEEFKYGEYAIGLGAHSQGDIQLRRSAKPDPSPPQFQPAYEIDPAFLQALEYVATISDAGIQDVKRGIQQVREREESSKSSLGGAVSEERTCSGTQKEHRCPTDIGHPGGALFRKMPSILSQWQESMAQMAEQVESESKTKLNKLDFNVKRMHRQINSLKTSVQRKRRARAAPTKVYYTPPSKSGVYLSWMESIINSTAL